MIMSFMDHGDVRSFLKAKRGNLIEFDHFFEVLHTYIIMYIHTNIHTYIIMYIYTYVTGFEKSHLQHTIINL